MRVPVAWLSEYADSALPVRQLEERLTMTGTKVEAVHHHGVGQLERFVVGRVLEAERHPDADRLSVCLVDVGDGDGVPQQIVCGAPNVAAGQTVAVARPGAVMPGGTELGVAKLRGVESHGMILAEDEVGIGTDHAGIMVLDDHLAPGTPLAQVLPIATEVLELEVTPNRPDCLGVYGVAREVHAATGALLAPPPWADDPGTPGAIEGVEVRVEAPDLCPRFTARVFEDVTIGPSPRWLKARLLAAGQRPINNVVDITNYAMLLVGQPLHAFDLDRVAGGRLVVRRARAGEQVTTLDGQVRTLDEQMLVIDDAEGPTSIAGVMGGERSEVQEGTTRVLMEVASWDGPNIHRTSQLLGLRSEASGRFEKGLAPEQAMEAQIVATKLMLELTGARLVPGTIDVGGPGPAPAVIRLREEKVAAILGRPIARDRQDEILRALEFGVGEVDDGLDVSVPAFRRNDVSREADLIEEVARIDGLEKLPATLPKRRGAAGRLTTAQRLRRRAVDALVGRGMYEIVGWSFTDPGLADRLRLAPDDPRRRFVALENPMSEDRSVMRTTLVGSLLDAARHNTARGMTDLALLECGAVYLDTGGRLPHEHRALGGVVAGRLHPQTWGTREPPTAGFFAAKGLLGAALDAVRVRWDVERATEPFLHPGRTARVLAGGEDVGWLGELHPVIARAWDLDAGATLFEIDLDRALGHADAVPQYVDLTSFPALRMDLSVTLPEDVPGATVVAAVREAGGELLTEARVFDLYHGEQVGEGRKSLALGLAFRASDRTLTDEDVAPLRARIVAALRDGLGGELRG
ncbi:MAG: phenylalanyl-tRNA synthetase beta chain [Solirubrobacteraceae bacterium]|jgi:phenylalanyl-tRNA synthetase beta chain|nr:phenylalanyl-tRNA synthetase beta chain [Solirubrobacteraceae bacterium]